MTNTPVGPRHRWRTTLLAEALLKALPKPGDVEVSPLLDAGCGRGTLGLRLAKCGHRILAFDLDLDRARVTRAAAQEAGLSQQLLAFVADTEAIPLRDSSVQGTAAGEVLEHVTRDDLAFAELARVLEEGGAMALTVPAGPDRLDDFDRSVGHLRRYDEAGLREGLNRAGLEIETQRAWGWPFGRVYDALVQRPALRAQAGKAGGLIRGMGRSKVLDLVWRGLFAVDDVLAPWAGERGSGWLVVGRKAGPPRATALQPKS